MARWRSNCPHPSTRVRSKLCRQRLNSRFRYSLSPGLGKLVAAAILTRRSMTARDCAWRWANGNSGRSRCSSRPTACRSRPGHPFYQKLNELLAEAGFDRWIEGRCRRYYAAEEKRGQPSIPPGVYFRMLLVGYFEGIDSQRGIAWRCADSLACGSSWACRWTKRRPITRR